MYNDYTSKVNKYMIGQPLLYDQIFSLNAKTIKKIVVSSKCSLKFYRTEGFSMTIISNNLINCKIDKNVLYIEPYTVYSWYCCCPITMCTPRNKATFSDTWKINAIFIVGEIVVNGSSSIFMEDGFDKNLICTKTGKYGKILFNKLYVSQLTCTITGNGTIECINSSCSNFIANISGVSKIITPRITNTANLNATDFGQINCMIYDKCIIKENINRFAKIHKSYAEGYTDI